MINNSITHTGMQFTSTSNFSKNANQTTTKKHKNDLICLLRRGIYDWRTAQRGIYDWRTAVLASQADVKTVVVKHEKIVKTSIYSLVQE